MSKILSGGTPNEKKPDIPFFHYTNGCGMVCNSLMSPEILYQYFMASTWDICLKPIMILVPHNARNTPRVIRFNGLVRGREDIIVIIDFLFL